MEVIHKQFNTGILMKDELGFQRDELLINLRPEGHLEVEAANNMGRFQGLTMIPIIKFQNDLLIFQFKSFLNKQKSGFSSLSIEHQKTFISDRIKSDQNLKSNLISYIVSMFNMDELRFYALHKAEIKKRILERLIFTLQDQVEELSRPL